MNNNIRTGQIRYVNFKGDVALQGGIRPALIILNEKGCIYSPRIWVIPLTTKTEKAKHLSMHIDVKKSNINRLKKDSVLLVEQAINVLKEEVLDLIGYMEDKYIYQAGIAWNNNCPMFPPKIISSLNNSHLIAAGW